jgi:DNA-binding NtrC family response regulator
VSKVLIVDDEPNLRRLYRESLEGDGHEVITAESAEDCLTRLEREPPDLVVLDVRMPGMDGLEALGKILERHPRMPVVLNSAFSSYRDNFLSWTADAYLVKSSDVGPLRSTVRRLLDAPGRGAAPSHP